MNRSLLLKGTLSLALLPAAAGITLAATHNSNYQTSVDPLAAPVSATLQRSPATQRPVEPGDDRAAAPTAARPIQPGDDRGGGTRHVEPGDDRGGTSTGSAATSIRSSRSAHPGVTRSSSRRTAQHVEPGDDRGVSRSSTARSTRHVEPGDDRGGV